MGAWWGPVTAAIARHPSLWSTALRQARRVVPTGWWRRPPFLPVPDREYVRFRLETQYGDGPPAPADVVTYLRWCRAEEQALRRRRPEGRR
jgi:hypothetical protein